MNQLVREATHDGRRIAVIRCFDVEGEGTVVDAEVTPPGSDQPIRRGPYRFPTAPDAFRFVQEVLLALQYLGCEVSAS